MTKLDSPWNILNLSRSQYFAKAPWKRAKMKRATFEELIRALPQDVIRGLQEEAAVERLVAAAFGHPGTGD